MKNDRERWDSRYRLEAGGHEEPDPFLVAHAELYSGGLALDLACGTGRNALFLARSGFTVEAIDISVAALKRLQSEARRRGVDVRCVAADLDIFPIPVDRYDLVVVVNFHSPRLIPTIKAATKCRGLIVYSTFNQRHSSLKPGFNPAYLVDSRELVRLFADCRVLVSEPDAGEAGNISRLIAQRC